jgi:hypothetical protein
MNLSVLDVIETKREQACNVVIIDGIKDLPARFAGADKVHLAQSAQLVRDSGFGHTESIGKGADAHFPVHEQGNQADTACVAECAEEFG